MNLSGTSKDPVEVLARAHVDGRMGYKIVYFTQLNPEQQFAYVLEKLVEHQKGTIALLEMSNILAQRTVEWRKTPEGQAWEEGKKTRSAS